MEQAKIQPGFTIFIPVKNGGNYIAPCIDSILAQKYSNFELIVLAGHSTDGTCEWLKSLGDKDPRISVRFSERELGIEGSWQRMATIPKREFLTIVGYDDLLEPDFLDEICSLIRNYPDASLYQTHFNMIDASGDLIRHSRAIPNLETASEFLAARMSIIRDSFGTGYVMRSKDYDRLGGIPMFKNLLYADDALWIGLMHTSFKAASPRICFSYRFHSGSISGTPDPEALFDALRQYLEYLRKLAVEDDALTRVIGYYAPLYVKNACQNYLNALYRESPLMRRIDPGKLAKLHELLQEYAPGARLDKNAMRVSRRLCRKASGLLAKICQS